MIKKAVSLGIFIVVCLILGNYGFSGSAERRVFNSNDNRGNVIDVCLNNNIPVTVKKKDRNLFFVKVQNRYAGMVRANSYGEAMQIACSKKTGPVLYNSKP